MSNKVTIKDVARECGVSIATVSYVINGISKVTEETKKRVLETIETLGYNPNLTARSLVKQESRLIGILVPISEKVKRTIFTDNPFYQEFFSGVEYKSREYEYSTTVIASVSIEKTLKLLKSRVLAGVMVLGAVDEAISNKLIEINVPVVVIDQKKNSEKYSYLNCEDEKGAFMAVDYLINMGHSNIGLITGTDDSRVITKRYTGYKNALKFHGIELKKEYIFNAEEVTYDEGIRLAEKVKTKIPEITAVFATADILALGLIKGLHSHNIYTPKDISVMGFDDIQFSKYYIPELTTIKQNIFEKGEQAVEILVNNINQGKEATEEYFFPVSLVERESVRRLIKDEK